MWSLILVCALVSFVNFAVHAAMTGLIVVVTRRTAARTDHLTLLFATDQPISNRPLSAVTGPITRFAPCGTASP
jgi:hypothetical protein